MTLLRNFKSDNAGSHLTSLHRFIVNVPRPRKLLEYRQRKMFYSNHIYETTVALVRHKIYLSGNVVCVATSYSIFFI